MINSSMLTIIWGDKGKVSLVCYTVRMLFTQFNKIAQPMCAMLQTFFKDSLMNHGNGTKINPTSQPGPEYSARYTDMFDVCCYSPGN